MAFQSILTPNKFRTAVPQLSADTPMQLNHRQYRQAGKLTSLMELRFWPEFAAKHGLMVGGFVNILFDDETKDLKLIPSNSNDGRKLVKHGASALKVVIRWPDIFPKPEASGVQPISNIEGVSDGIVFTYGGGVEAAKPDNFQVNTPAAGTTTRAATGVRQARGQGSA